MDVDLKEAVIRIKRMFIEIKTLDHYVMTAV